MKALIPADDCRAWALRNPLQAAWNLDFSRDRWGNTRRLIHRRLRVNPKGQGNKAWARAERLTAEWRASSRWSAGNRRCNTYEAAEEHGRELAAKYRLEMVNEAMPTGSRNFQTWDD